jgi:chromate transporter
MRAKSICTEASRAGSLPPGEVQRVSLGHIARAFLGIGLASFSLAALGEARDCMKRREWFTDDEYMQGLALAQLMPGAPTVNLCSYLGYCLRGLPGAAVATVSFLIPSFLLMLLLSHLYLRYGEMPIVSGLFRGLGALVVGLVFNTILNLWRTGVKTTFNWLMALIGFTVVFWLKMGVIKILLIAGGASLITVLLTKRFPALSRWTGSWSQLWKGDETTFGVKTNVRHKLKRGSLAPLRNGKDSEAISFSEVSRVSASSEVYQPFCWLGLGKLLSCLFLILALFLLSISQRPELMQMGSRFLRIGALVFGSGYAMLPFIQDTVVNQFGWLTNQQFAVALALSLITPGPVTIIGTFIGFKAAGIVGALVGMVSMYFPAWAMTTVVTAPYSKAGQAGYFKQVISGIAAAFIGTLVVVLVKLTIDTLIDIPSIAMAVAAFVVQRFIKIDTIWIVLGGAIVSLVVFH